MCIYLLVTCHSLLHRLVCPVVGASTDASDLWDAPPEWVCHALLLFGGSCHGGQGQERSKSVPPRLQRDRRGDPHDGQDAESRSRACSPHCDPPH